MSSQVYEQLGGVVEHRGSDAWELPDDTKLLQRLYALNILRLEGHQPDAALWTVSMLSPHLQQKWPWQQQHRSFRCSLQHSCRLFFSLGL